MTSFLSNAISSVRSRLPLSILITATVLCLMIIAMGSSQFPIMDGDSICFLPAAINYANGSGLTNPLYHPAHVFDALHPEKLTWHGFLYPQLLGFFAPTPTYENLRMIITVLRCAVLWISAFALSRALPESGSGSYSRSLIAITSLVGICGLIPDGGRPELLVCFLIACGVAILLWAPLKWHRLSLGVTMGLLIATSPVPAIIAGEIVGLYFCVRLRAGGACKSLFFTGAVALATFAACFMTYQFTLDAWVHGMLFHAENAIVDQWSTMREAIRDDLALVGFILILGLTTLLGAMLFVKRRDLTKFKFGAAFSALILTASVYYFWVRVPVRTYNVTCLGLIPILALGCGSIRFMSMFSSRPAGLKHPGVVLLGVCLLLPSVMFIRWLFIFPFFLKYGVSYQAARDAYREIRKTGSEIGFTGGFFTLAEDYEKTLPILPDAPMGRFLFMQQTNRRSKSVSPPDIAGYTLIDDKFSPVQPRLFGFKYSSTVCGYNYAVYKKNDADGE